MKPLLAALALAALAPAAAASTTTLQAGPIAAHATWNETPHCLAMAPQLPCPLGYDSNSTLAPSDDTLHAYRSLERAEVGLQAPLPLQRVETDLRTTRVPHHLVDTADAILVPAEASLPEPLGERTYVQQAPNATGLWLRVLDPGNPATGQEAWLPIILVGTPYTDRNGTTTPNGIGTDGDDSDDWGPDMFRLLRLCELPQLGDDGFLLCDALPVKALGEAWPALTPRVLTGVAANETALALGDAPPPPAAGPGPAGEQGSGSLGGTTGGYLPAQDEALRLLGGDERLAALGPPSLSAAARDASDAEARFQRLQATTSASLPPWVLAAALLLAPLLWLFHRVTRARSLDHAHRARLLELANATPGILVGEAARILDVTYHCARHHARVLHRCGHLELVQAGRYTALYPAFAVALRHRVPLVHLRRGPQAQTLRLLQEHPGAGVMQLAQRTSCSKSAMSAKLQRLRAQGLVEKDGRSYFITALGLEAMMLLPGSPGSALPGLEPAPPHAGGGSATSPLGPGSMP